MSTGDLILVAIAVSMDAFAVAICKGLSLTDIKLRDSVIVGLWFGLFQAIMPLIGYFLGSAFYRIIEKWDHWIAFGLLVFLGVQMILEARRNESCPTGGIAPGQMLPLAIATSIDALAVGITMAFLEVNPWSSISLIGSATFTFSLAGVWIGHFFGQRFRKPAQTIGGVVLILIGAKILLQHTGILA